MAELDFTKYLITGAGTVINMVDCRAREGGTTLHCRAQTPCLACQLAAANKRADAAINDAVNKGRSASDEQISALNRLEGHDPQDIEKISRKTFEIAALKVQLAAANKRADAAEKDANRYRWLRECVYYENGRLNMLENSEPKTVDDFDKAIDEAMKNG